MNRTSQRFIGIRKKDLGFQRDCIIQKASDIKIYIHSQHQNALSQDSCTNVSQMEILLIER